MYAMPQPYFYPSQFYCQNYQQTNCASSDTTLVDEDGAEEINE
jgi:hypothetical protein